MRHKFAADERNQKKSGAKNQGRDHKHGLGMIERPVQLAGVLLLHPLKGAVVMLAHAFLEPKRSQDGNQGQGKNERANQGEGHGLRHGMKQFP